MSALVEDERATEEGTIVHEVLREAAQATREALRDWPGTLRLLCLIAAVTLAALALR